MTPERWQAIGDLFDQALSVPTSERAALIDRASGTDEEVRREVVSLLKSHHAAPGGFVQKRINVALESFHQTSTAASTPARVGPYRLVRELGRGGMGAVFLAERDDAEYHAEVAVKLVRPGMDTEFILARFRRERQTLARLQHPNISRLLDGGTTDHGLPYIVMEYIDGPWITTYAAQRALEVEPRLRLFLAVCSAVDYAHRNFVVHRDLKPGNILVDAGGVPKLLDFGICKLLVESVNANDTVAAALTPNYASPEQIRGEAATISSDVYSLGAVLYELLTGTVPRRFANLTPLAIARALEGPIVRPSVAVGDPRLARQLAGDLDNILLRALDVEPARRYESAAQLADDLRRHLEHEPVRATPLTFGYRAGTFVRRHRGLVAGVAALSATLIAGLAVSWYQARGADASDSGSVLSRVETAMDDDLPTAAAQPESLRVLDEAARTSPNNVTLQIYRALVHLHLGDSLTAAGKLDDARVAYLDSAAISEPYLKLGHVSLLVLFMRANQRLALNAVGRARRADALEFAERVVRTGESPLAGTPSARAGPRGSSAMGLTYAALVGSPVGQPADREDAVSWLRKAAAAWQAAQSDPAFAASHRREMRQVEDALARLERQ